MSFLMEKSPREIREMDVTRSRALSRLSLINYIKSSAMRFLENDIINFIDEKFIHKISRCDCEFEQ